MKPEVLILDEPTAGLDPKGRDDLFKMLINLNIEQNITIIIVSHSMEDVAKYVKRLIVMNDGEIVFDDTPLNVFKNYKQLEQIGLLLPQVTYIMQSLKANGFSVNTNIITIEEAKKEILKVLRK